MKDQTEVCPLSRGVMSSFGFNPYLPHYKGAFAFSVLLCPHPFGLSLRRAFPCGRDTDLPCSALVPRWVRLRLSAGDVSSTMRETGYPHTHHVPFGSSLSASLACFPLTAFISDSLLLAIPSNPSAPTALMLAVFTSLTVLLSFVRRASLSWKLPTPGLL